MFREYTIAECFLCSKDRHKTGQYIASSARINLTYKDLFILNFVYYNFLVVHYKFYPRCFYMQNFVSFMSNASIFAFIIFLWLSDIIFSIENVLTSAFFPACPEVISKSFSTKTWQKKTSKHRNPTSIQKNLYTPMFIAVLFIVANRWKQR